MSLNSTVIMTIVLLVMMFGAGIFSSSSGYKLGRDALKEITQPDVRPSNITDRINNSSSRQEGVKLLREEDIIAQVKKRIAAGGVDPDPPAQPQAQEKPQEQNQAQPETTNQVVFPIVSRDGGVTLEITSAQRRSNSLQLNVNLKNEGDQSVRFLYSFLNVTDNQGRALSASVDSLPGQLPPGSQTYTGTIAISTALLDNVQELAISLTDYPDQKLQLQMSGIPVVQ
ncbi:MAG: hypothetical protein EA414_00635 [Arthrospira sp. PLM2.Bin9]|nr:MAG: hypothetical protein EA414_00635 [Arthrospira sp. PLM2.Bin9]